MFAGDGSAVRLKIFIIHRRDPESAELILLYVFR